MVFAAHRRHPVPAAAPVAAQAPAARKDRIRRLFAALIDAISASPQRQAERRMERLLERTGGRLTDDVERSATRERGSGDNDRFFFFF